MDAICSSETSVDFQRTTRSYISEDSTLRIIRSLCLGYQDGSVRKSHTYIEAIYSSFEQKFVSGKVKISERHVVVFSIVYVDSFTVLFTA
jgi:hypothetical protein